MSLIKNLRAARALANTKKVVSATGSVVGKDNSDDMIALVDSLLFSMVHDHQGIIEILATDSDNEQITNLFDTARQSILRIVGKLPASLWDQIALGRKATAVRQIVDAVEGTHLDFADDFLLPAARRWGFLALIDDGTDAKAPATTTPTAVSV